MDKFENVGTTGKWSANLKLDKGMQYHDTPIFRTLHFEGLLCDAVLYFDRCAQNLANIKMVEVQWKINELPLQAEYCQPANLWCYFKRLRMLEV